MIQSSGIFYATMQANAPHHDPGRRPAMHDARGGERGWYRFSGLAILVLLALTLAAVWRWTALGDWAAGGELPRLLTELRGSGFALLIVPAVYLLGGFLVFPVTLLILATGLAFGAWYGFLYALLGTELSAIVLYGIGRQLGRNHIRRLSHRWIHRVSQRLGQQGLLAIITLRVVPVAPFSVINLLAGASHIRFRDYVVGTLLGMMPGIIALTLFSHQVLAAVQSPDALRTTLLLLLVIAIGAGVWGLRCWALRRQAAAAGTGSPPKTN
jgi:uncharacterized membrane protein YdjX (TVP38/TMEM64 family)